MMMMKKICVYIIIFLAAYSVLEVAYFTKGQLKVCIRCFDQYGLLNVLFGYNIEIIPGPLPGFDIIIDRDFKLTEYAIVNDGEVTSSFQPNGTEKIKIQSENYV